MGKNELSDNDKKRLADFATKEAQLLWSRYGCMVVANSILLGFIGQLATKKCNGSLLGIIACVMGLLIALLWLLITSCGWSLSWYILKESDAIEQTKYQEWKDEMCKCKIWKNYLKSKDPIWLCAHLVILAFCLAYILLTLEFTKCYVLPLVLSIVFIIGFVFWLMKFS